MAGTLNDSICVMVICKSSPNTTLLWAATGRGQGLNHDISPPGKYCCEVRSNVMEY